MSTAKTEAARLAHNERNRAYHRRKMKERGVRQFDASAYPLKLKLQRILCNVRYRCNHRERYAGRGIRCQINFADIHFLWQRDGAGKMARPSIDRIDNDSSYTRDNCRFIELYENIRRGVQVRVSKHLPAQHQGAA